MVKADRVDVVIVGGGIAGSALAAVLARDGYQVLVLEQQRRYRDKIRGEVVNCWGVVELLRLGLERTLLDAGGGYADRFVGYDETIDPAGAEAIAMPLDQQLSGIRGILDVGHPEACTALSDAAAGAGATVIRGVGKVAVTAGSRPVVRYEVDEVEHEVSCRLIAGADGRQSGVRRQLGIQLEQTPPRSLGGGLLVDNLHPWPANTSSIGTEGDILYFVFPRPGGIARLYILHDVTQRNRFAGPNARSDFLTAFQLRCIPGSDMFARARPASTCCAFYPMNDSWTERPFTEGAVLLGDAAGWSDPIVGQGTSVALRDARIVWETLRSGADWSPRAFEPYRQERRERMRRLRLAGVVRSEMHLTFTPDGRRRRMAYRDLAARDPVVAGTRLVTYRGPDGVPDQSFEPETIERILAPRLTGPTPAEPLERPLKLHERR